MVAEPCGELCMPLCLVLELHAEKQSGADLQADKPSCVHRLSLCALSLCACCPPPGKSHSLPDRIESLAKRAINWANLRKKKNAEKKVAITVFSFPPDKGNVGTAAYLNVFGSIFRVLQNLKACGYNVGSLPGNEMDLIQVNSVSGVGGVCWPGVAPTA